MTKTILLSITLLACTAWMAAQSTPSSGSQDSTAGQTGSQSSTGASQSSSGMNGSSTSTGSETTIRGCLNSAGGGYTLTDASGTTYQLQGDTSKLSAHANEEVEVKGTASDASAAGTAGSSADSSSSASSGSTGAAGAQAFNVTKVKKVSGSCNASK